MAGYDDDDDFEDRPASRRRRFQDDEEEYDLLKRERGHSALGVVSLIIAVLTGVGLLALFGVAGVMMEEAGGDLDEDSPQTMLLGLLALLALLFLVIGLGLGLAGVLQKDRNKLFGTLGLVANALVLLGSLGLMCVGALMN